ncbi:MAG: carboxypeptidase-like regulatory domain-containing protein [Leadbetterella sp.]|nr:carboxypeptidase-like regulatory domain-containing protein [Leadbetterella sp.]
MSKILHCRLLLVICLFLTGTAFTYGQTEVTGTIEDAKTKEPLVGVSVQVKGKVIGTITDINGKFKLNTSTPPPFDLIISSVGYKAQEVRVDRSGASLKISLEDQSILGQEIVVSASRVAESEMKSPVTVEKIDLRTIRETTASNFYDAMGNMKGINLTTQGLLFKSVNMRGFSGTGNPRVVQMIDGMDNMSPALNFAVDNIVGMPELDVESVEVLPGAASALYGPNAINGLILMNSKSPFLYQGASANVRTGIMHEGGRTKATTPFYDASIRYAKAFNDKVAFKVNLSYLTADDWQARNFTNLNVGGVENGTRGAGVDLDYNGLNVYGDEVRQNLQEVAAKMVTAGVLTQAQANFVPNVAVSRTGFRESDMIDSETHSFKTNLALHYRPTEKMELIGQYNLGLGSTLYTGTGRYALKDFSISQAKLELRGDNFNLRAYTTMENSGKSAFLGLSAIQLLDEVKPHGTWYGEYIGTYLGALQAGASADQAHAAARSQADKGMPVGQDLKDRAAAFNNKPIVNGGGGFLDKSNLRHFEGMYNFKNQISFMDLLVGANYRVYNLRSDGTLFNDKADGRDGRIGINEYGAYVQAGKGFFNDHFRLVASIRYDKNQNFEGQYSPRVSGIFSFGESNIRLSYQTGFRIPTTQNQYINLKTPQGTLIGGMPEFDNIKAYNLAGGITKHTLDQFQVFVKQGNPLGYFNAAQQAQIVGAIQAYAKQFALSQQPAVVSGVTQAVLADVTSKVTAQVQAAVAAGQIPAAQAPAVIQAQVQAQMQSDQVKQIIQQQVTTQLESIATRVGTDPRVGGAFALAALPKYQAKALKPEKITSYEIGYKGLIAKRLFVDAYYYYSRYENYIGATSIVVPTAPASALPGLPLESGIGVEQYNGYSRPSNTEEKITADGWAVSLNYSLNKGYNVGVNVSNNRLRGFEASPEQLYAGYNTPEYIYNVSFGKRLGSGDRFGFNVNLRHQTEFVWQSGFGSPNDATQEFFTNAQVPAITNLDAQVSAKLPAIKSILKVGGNNIGGKAYYQAFGSAMVGSTYYVSLTFDQLFNR